MTGNIVITTLTTTSASSAIGSGANPIVNIYATSLSGQLKGTIASTVTGTLNHKMIIQLKWQPLLM